MTRRRRLLLALSVLLCAAAVLVLPYRSWRAHAHLRASRQALAARDFERARDHLLAYLEARPNSAEAHLLMARTSRLAGFVDEAEVRLDVCDLLRPSDDATALERVLLETQQGDLSRDAALWERARAGHPEAAAILEALARGYRKNYLLDAMRRALDAWLEREPGCAEALMQRGWAHESRHTFEAALGDYRRAVAADPGHELALLRTAQALVLLERGGEAIDTFRSLRERRPADPEVGVGLAQALRQVGRLKEARAVLDALLAEYPREFHSLLEMGRVLIDAGEPARAEPLVRKALERSPNDYQANYVLFTCLRRLGRAADAEAAQARVRAAQADARRMHELTDLLQKRPDDPGLRCEIGTIFLRSGEEKEGMLWLKSALRADPGHPPAHEALAAHYDKQGRASLAAHHRRLKRR